MTRRALRWYGASPLHLAALAVSFVVAAYAASRLVPADPRGVVLWFVGAVVAHDLVLFPAYTVADRLLQRGLRPRRRPAAPHDAATVNHIRIPALLSALLLLIWFPLIFGLPGAYQGITGYSTAPYLTRWLTITAALFAASAVVYGIRSRRRRRLTRLWLWRGIGRGSA
jgi:hypothetical protein